VKEVAMLKEIYPRGHQKVLSLPVLGPHATGFVDWLVAQGYPPLPIKLRLRAMRDVDAILCARGVSSVDELSEPELLELAPEDSQEDIYRAAVIRSLVRYFSAYALLKPSPLTPAEQLVREYVTYLDRVRGLAKSTLTHHAAAAREMLTFVGFDGDLATLEVIGPGHIEGFVRQAGARLSRAGLQHVVAYVRSFLRFLAAQGLVERGLDTQIDTPRLYRGECLPRSLPWETVRNLLGAVDRTTEMGKRDYAMLLLITTYGLRTSEVAHLRLEDIYWRAKQLRIPRSKTSSRLVVPLTPEVGVCLLEYLRHARPKTSHREVFLRVRAPVGPLRPTAVTEAFQNWVRRSGLPIPYQGPHCLRHSLAVHLLRRGASLKTIGDLLGHRSIESTCVYLRLHVEDLREVALDLPKEVLR
jgi:site-specific recombinase XerD